MSVQLTAPQLAPVNDIRDLQKLMLDLQTFLNNLLMVMATLNSPAATPTILVVTDTGVLDQYTLVAGAGVTITRDDVAKTWTISSP